MNDIGVVRIPIWLSSDNFAPRMAYYNYQEDTPIAMKAIPDQR